MLKATADSNIYISALNFGGIPDQILNLARSGAVRLSISDAILNEISRVLLHKFGWAQELIVQACEQIQGFAEVVESAVRIAIVSKDPTDNRILECAHASGSDFLITGDRHLLDLIRYESIRIVSPAEFIETFRSFSR